MSNVEGGKSSEKLNKIYQIWNGGRVGRERGKVFNSQPINVLPEDLDI